MLSLLGRVVTGGAVDGVDVRCHSKTGRGTKPFRVPAHTTLSISSHYTVHLLTLPCASCMRLGCVLGLNETEFLLQTLQLLLQHRAHPLERDVNGLSALHHVANRGQSGDLVTGVTPTTNSAAMSSLVCAARVLLRATLQECGAKPLELPWNAQVAIIHLGDTTMVDS